MRTKLIKQLKRERFSLRYQKTRWNSTGCHWRLWLRLLWPWSLTFWLQHLWTQVNLWPKLGALPFSGFWDMVFTRLPLLSTRPAVTFPAKEITPLVGTKLYCLVTEAHRCKCPRPLHNGAQPGFERATSKLQVWCHSATASQLTS